MTAEERKDILQKSGFKTKWFWFYLYVLLPRDFLFILGGTLYYLLWGRSQNTSETVFQFILYCAYQLFSLSLISFSFIQLRKLTHEGYIVSQFYLAYMAAGVIWNTLAGIPQRPWQQGDLGTISTIMAILIVSSYFALQIFYFKKRRALFENSISKATQ